MKFSKNWLQQYSKETLPDTKILEEVITLNAFEIEEITTYKGDDILDIKVLPNRAHDALGHKGMAKDIAALCNLTFVDPYTYYSQEGDADIVPPTIVTEDGAACTRFMSVRVDGVTVTESPEWLREALLSIGQKSINSIVDITNYVQFAINKPMHAYDASLIKDSTLVARFAKEGEVLITLDDKSLSLDARTLVIADTEKPLGLAGIKGGKSSGVSKETTSLIIESANFNSPLIRKTSQKYGIRTDASKRFENEISDDLVEDGLRMTIALIKELNKDARVSDIVDVRNNPRWDYVVSVSKEEINNNLGTVYTDDDIAKVFSSLLFPFRKATTKEMIEERLKGVSGATFKNPSSMRADAPHSFSCSSLISFLFNGVWQPSVSIDKYVYAEKITQDEARFGDLVFSNTGDGTVRFESVSFLEGTKVSSGIDHVGLYMGDGNVLHISKKNNAIVTESLATSEQFKEGVLFGRITNVDEERYFITVPYERLDIRIKEDLIEEVARVKKLSSIQGVLPKLARKGIPHKRLYYENKIKNILHGHGFSEIMTYSFGDVGEVEIRKGLAQDKEKLRSSLSLGVLGAFNKNMLNAPLLGTSLIKMYEFGNVFTKTTERRELAIIIDDGKKKSSFTDDVDYLLSEIKRELGISSLSYETVSAKPYCIVIDFDALIASLQEAGDYVPLIGEHELRSYVPISPYPFIVRDIAVWVNEEVTWEDILSLVNAHRDDLIVRVDLFDTFTKTFEDGTKKTSYAFRLVIVSFEKTLTDEEANTVAERIYNALKEKEYEIR